MNEESRGPDLGILCTCVLPPPLETPPSGSMISGGLRTPYAAATVTLNFRGRRDLPLSLRSQLLQRERKKFVRRNLMFHERVQFLETRIVGKM